MIIILLSITLIILIISIIFAYKNDKMLDRILNSLKNISESSGRIRKRKLQKLPEL